MYATAGYDNLPAAQWYNRRQMTELKECTDQKVWDKNILQRNGHPFQLWGWGEVKGRHSWKALRLYTQHGANDPYGKMAQVLIRILPKPFGAFAYIPRGSGEYSREEIEFLNRVGDYVKHEFGAIVLSIEPQGTKEFRHDGWLRSTQTIFPDCTVLLDLQKSEDQLLSEMSKSTRQSIRKSTKRLGDIRILSDEGQLQDVLAIYHKTAELAGFAIHSDAYYETVRKALGKQSIIYGAYIDNELVGFLWVASTGGVAYQMYSGVTSEGRASRANYALRWHAITEAKKSNVLRYDFGGVIKGGVEEFKRGWSSELVDLTGTYDKPLSRLYTVWAKTIPVVRKTTQTMKRIKRAVRS